MELRNMNNSSRLSGSDKDIANGIALLVVAAKYTLVPIFVLILVSLGEPDIIDGFVNILMSVK